MDDRQFTAQEIEDAVGRTFVRLEALTSQLRKNRGLLELNDLSVGEAHDFGAVMSNVTTIVNELSIQAGFKGCWLKDKQAEGFGLRANTIYGATSQIISLMLERSPLKSSPEAMVVMEMFAKELGIKNQYLAARSKIWSEQRHLNPSNSESL